MHEGVLKLKQLSFNYSTPPAVRGRLSHLEQLDGVFESWSKRFLYFLKKPFRVSFHDNSSTMISSRFCHGMLHIRLHHMFLDANDMDLKALASYLRGSRKGSVRLDRFIQQNQNKVKRKILGTSRGDCYDLNLIRNALNRCYFNPPLDVTVVWGSRTNVRRRRSIRLGSYAFDDRVVRIHPVLDSNKVPAYVVVSVVHHEMLHHALGMSMKNGKRLLHPPEFKQKEKLYVHYRRAEDWIRKNLSKLLKTQRDSNGKK